MRDVKYDRQLGRLVSLTTNGAVQIWDPHLSHIRTVGGPHHASPAPSWAASHCPGKNSLKQFGTPLLHPRIASCTPHEA